MSNAYTMVPQDARRQLRMSIGLVLCMAIGAVAVGFATHPHQQPRKAVLVDEAGVFSGRLVSLNEK